VHHCVGRLAGFHARTDATRATQNWRCSRAIPSGNTLEIPSPQDLQQRRQAFATAAVVSAVYGSFDGQRWQRLPPRDRPHTAPGALVVGDSREMPSKLDDRRQLTARLVRLTYRRGRCLINAEHVRAWAGLVAGASATDRDAPQLGQDRAPTMSVRNLQPPVPWCHMARRPYGHSLRRRGGPADGTRHGPESPLLAAQVSTASKSKS
jgi:hypothetical protein